MSVPFSCVFQATLTNHPRASVGKSARSTWSLFLPPPALLLCSAASGSACARHLRGALWASSLLSPTCCLSGRQHLRFDGWDLWFLLFSWEHFFVPSIQTREKKKTQSYRKRGKYVLIVLANPAGEIPSNMLCG